MPSIDMTNMVDKEVFRNIHNQNEDIDLFEQNLLNNDTWFKTFDIRDIPI